MNKRERPTQAGSQIQRLEQAHQSLKEQVAMLDRRRFLSDAEARLRGHLKRKKLRVKDDLTEALRRAF